MSNGFEHRQNSGYAIYEEKTATYIRALTFKLLQEQPYIRNYVRKMDATIIKPEYIYDCTELFDEDSEVVEYTGELETHMTQSKTQVIKMIDQSQSEDITPQELKSGVLERKVEIPIKPLENTTDEDKTEMVKKTPKIKM